MGSKSYQPKLSKHTLAKKKSTTQLPQRLLDELYNKNNKKVVEIGNEVREGSTKKRKGEQVRLESSEDIVHDKRKFAKKFVNRSASRKEKRKEERKNKKQRVQPLSKQANPTVPKIEESKPKPEPKSDTPPTKKEINSFKSKKVDETPFSPKISREEIEEDRYLRSLEKKLKIKDVSKLSKSKSFIEDGLDELLSGIAIGSSKLRKDKTSLIEHSEDSVSENEVFEGAHYYSTRNVDNEDKESVEDSDSESETSEASQDSCKSESSPKDSFPSEVTFEKIQTKYVPPHLRNSEDKLVRLRRLIQGLLNKLGESNIETILFEIDGFYLDYSRNAVTTTLTELILLSVKNRPVLHDSFVIVNAALVAGLYRIIGLEAAAHFTQTLVEQLLDHHKKAQDPTNSSTESDDSKLCVNLTTLVAELYNLGVVSCVLIYSLIRFFLESLDDLNIELLLKTIRAIGPSLRQDDPSAMKDIIIMAQKAAADRCNLGARYKFMMEVLIDLKNNKLKKSSHLATQAAISDEMVRRMKTMLKNLENQRQIMGSEPLQVSIQDILNASEKGKWWLVGSAWKGNEQPIQAPIQASSNQPDQDTTDFVDSNNPNSLLRLAREQSMSTDIRKRIFTVLMSSEDFSDAYERLMKLGLTEKQQRDIPRVVLHCCGNEKTYNPFYSLVAASLNGYSTSYKITFQYALWDFLRELGETGVGGLASSYNSAPSKASQVPVRRILNSAKFFAYLLSKLSLPLTVLKSLSFTSLQSRTKLFLQLLLAYTLLQADDTTLSTQVAKLADLPDLRQGLSFFLHHFVIPSDAMISLSDFDLNQVSSKGKFLAELLLASDC